MRRELEHRGPAGAGRVGDAKLLIAGESPLRVWRELRGLSQVKLGAVAGVKQVQIADIKARRGKGSVETVRKLAEALGVRVDDLV